MCAGATVVADFCPVALAGGGFARVWGKRVQE